MRFRLAPKSVTLKGRNVTLAEINKISGAHDKNFNEDRLILSSANVGLWSWFPKI